MTVADHMPVHRGCFRRPERDNTARRRRGVFEVVGAVVGAWLRSWRKGDDLRGDCHRAVHVVGGFDVLVIVIIDVDSFVFRCF